MLRNREVREEITSLWCLTWYVAPKVSMKTTLAMNQHYITGVPVATARTHKGWHERRRQRVCSLPIGECFSRLLSWPKHTQLWWLSRWLPGLLNAFVPRMISCCQRWQEVIWWCCPQTECGASNSFRHILEEGLSWLSVRRQSTLTNSNLLHHECYFCNLSRHLYLLWEHCAHHVNWEHHDIATTILTGQ